MAKTCRWYRIKSNLTEGIEHICLNKEMVVPVVSAMLGVESVEVTTGIVVRVIAEYKHWNEVWTRKTGWSLEWLEWNFGEDWREDAKLLKVLNKVNYRMAELGLLTQELKKDGE